MGLKSQCQGSMPGDTGKVPFPSSGFLLSFPGLGLLPKVSLTVISTITPAVSKFLLGHSCPSQKDPHNLRKVSRPQVLIHKAPQTQEASG